MSSAFEPARAVIDGKLREAGFVICALEGGAASGKSTLAGQLSEAYGAPVIAMDDFFLPPALRTDGRFAEVGGNIDYERFDRQVAAPLRAHIPFSYSIYDCHADRMAGEKRVPAAAVILVEGVYCLHPRFRDAYNLRLFLRTAQETQDQRLRQRGEWLYQQFQKVWLPLEKAYFASEDWDRLCDAVIET